MTDALSTLSVQQPHPQCVLARQHHRQQLKGYQAALSNRCAVHRGSAASGHHGNLPAAAAVDASRVLSVLGLQCRQAGTEHTHKRRQLAAASRTRSMPQKARYLLRNAWWHRVAVNHSYDSEKVTLLMINHPAPLAQAGGKRINSVGSARVGSAREMRQLSVVLLGKPLSRPWHVQFRFCTTRIHCQLATPSPYRSPTAVHTLRVTLCCSQAGKQRAAF